MQKFFGFMTLVVALAIASTPAHATTFTFIGSGGACGCDGNWDDEGDWVGGSGFPGAGDTAIIPAGKECSIDDEGNQFAAVIDVQGKLILLNDAGEGAATLTITDDSTVDGTLRIDPEARLIIADDLTITGAGGDIAIGAQSSIVNGSIDDNGTAYELTLANECGANPLDESCSVMVRGHGQINVKLNNNGIVRADVCVLEPQAAYKILELNNGAKRGSGNWEAECTGWLEVNTEVTGNGTWRIADGVSNDPATIVVNSCLMGLTGAVQMGAGTLDVNDNFCTTGLLHYVSGSGSPVIKVAAGSTAEFSVDSCGSCPQ